MAIVTVQDVDDRLSAQARARLFAKNGGNAVDTAFQALCVTEANSRIGMWTKAAFPNGFEGAGGTVDVGIVGLAVDVVCGIAASRHASADPTVGAFAKGYAEARAFFKALTRDDNARPVTSAAGRAKPNASNTNVTDATGQPTNPLTRAADGTDRSDF